jgi:hypothetical protein
MDVFDQGAFQPIAFGDRRRDEGAIQAIVLAFQACQGEETLPGVDRQGTITKRLRPVARARTDDKVRSLGDERAITSFRLPIVPRGDHGFEGGGRERCGGSRIAAAAAFFSERVDLGHSSDTRPSDVVDLFETLKPIYAEISDPMRTVTS